MPQQTQSRIIECEIVVNASLNQVWEAWTTSEGAETFFAPRCIIDARPAGRYEMLFDLGAKPGKQGGEGIIVLAVQQQQMLSFTWNAPPHLSDVRKHMTHVTLYFQRLGPKCTKVILNHDGWGHGDEWEEAHEYFRGAWKIVVLPRLKYRFEFGPIDWKNPPDVSRI